MGACIRSITGIARTAVVMGRSLCVLAALTLALVLMSVSAEEEDNSWVPQGQSGLRDKIAAAHLSQYHADLKGDGLEGEDVLGASGLQSDGPTDYKSLTDFHGAFESEDEDDNESWVPAGAMAMAPDMDSPGEQEEEDKFPEISLLQVETETKTPVDDAYAAYQKIDYSNPKPNNFREAFVAAKSHKKKTHAHAQLHNLFKINAMDKLKATINAAVKHPKKATLLASQKSDAAAKVVKKEKKSDAAAKAVKKQKKKVATKAAIKKAAKAGAKAVKKAAPKKKASKKATVSQAKVLRAKARKDLRKAGKPIPASLKKGGLKKILKKAKKTAKKEVKKAVKKNTKATKKAKKAAPKKAKKAKKAAPKKAKKAAPKKAAAPKTSPCKTLKDC